MSHFPRVRLFYFPQMDVENSKNSYFTVIKLILEKTFVKGQLLFYSAKFVWNLTFLIVYGGLLALFEEEFLLFRRNLQ